MTSRLVGPAAWTGIALMLGLPALLASFFGWAPSPLLSDGWALHPSAGLHQSPWSWWTCVWLHANTRHLWANLAGLVMVVALGWLVRLPPRAALAWALAWPLTHLALLLDPRLDTYYGLSGVLHAGLSIVAATLIMQGRSHKWSITYGWLLLLGILAKCWLENPSWAALLPRPGLAMNAAPMSHLAGTLVGLGITLTLSLRQPHGCSKSRP